MFVHLLWPFLFREEFQESRSQSESGRIEFTGNILNLQQVYSGWFSWTIMDTWLTAVMGYHWFALSLVKLKGELYILTWVGGGCPKPKNMVNIYTCIYYYYYYISFFEELGNGGEQAVDSNLCLWAKLDFNFQLAQQENNMALTLIIALFCFV